jgi:hypothetical protein
MKETIDYKKHINEIVESLSNVDTYLLFDKWLNDTHELFEVGRYNYSASFLLYNADREEYTNQFLEWLDYSLNDTKELVELDNKFYLKEDIEELLDSKEG